VARAHLRELGAEDRDPVVEARHPGVDRAGGATPPRDVARVPGLGSRGGRARETRALVVRLEPLHLGLAVILDEVVAVSLAALRELDVERHGREPGVLP